jgi:hypothetical protein
MSTPCGKNTRSAWPTRALAEAAAQQGHPAKLQVGKDTSQYRPQQRTAQALSKGMGSGQRHQKYRVGVAQEAFKKANATVLMSMISLPAWQSSKADQADLTTMHGLVQMAQHGLLKMAAAAAAAHMEEAATASAAAAAIHQAAAAAIHQAAAAAAAAVHQRRTQPMGTQ